MTATQPRRAGHDATSIARCLRNQALARLSDPDEVRRNADWGATGATSNPIIVSDLIRTGRFDSELATLIREGLDDEAISWQLTDLLVRRAQEVFQPAWEQTRGDDG